MVRIDAHRPSVVVPADYEFIAHEYIKVEDIGDAEFLRVERARIARHMASTGGTYSKHQHGGNCHICGAHALYTALFYHRPSNSYVRTGMDCAQKLDYDSGEGETFRTHAKAALELQAGRRKAQAILDREGLAAAWAVYLSDCDVKESRTVRDMVGKLVAYGELSEKQINYLRLLMDRIARRPEIEAKRAADYAASAALPVSDKRQTIKGTVLSIKAPDEYSVFGGSKMLVKSPDGWKVFGSLPSCQNGDIAIGCLVEFSATIKQSDKDPKFGFFSRPTKCRVIQS
jgi:hypothetical protein